MRRGAKVGPAGVLELRDFAHALEGVVRVGEGEFADDDVGLFGAGGGVAGFAGEVGGFGGVGGAPLAYAWTGGVAAAVDPGGLEGGAVLS